MRNDQPDELDRILDQALETYSRLEPRPGLEQRVLSRVRADGGRKRSGWWLAAFAIPVLASVILAVMAWRARPIPVAPPHTLATVPATQVLPPITSIVPAQARPAPRRLHSRAAPVVLTARSLPRRNVFPVPEPLSSEERAVMDLVARFPDQARAALLTDQAIKPIEIERIQIPPLSGGRE